MANTKTRTYRVLAWAMAIVLTVLSLPIVPFSTWSTDLSESIGDSVSLNAHAYSFDNRNRVGAWWWYSADGTNATTREKYLTSLEKTGVTEIYYYDYSNFTSYKSGTGNATSGQNTIHTFVQAAMAHGMAVSIMIDDGALWTNATTSRNTISKLAEAFSDYKAEFGSDWLYGIHFDCEPEGDVSKGKYSQTMLQQYLDNLLNNSMTYLVPAGAYIEFCVNSAWYNGKNCTYTYGGTTYTGYFNAMAGVLANGVGCLHIMAYRTTAALILSRAKETYNETGPYGRCEQYNTDMVIGMECTPGEGNTVSLPDAGLTKMSQVKSIVDDLYDLMAAEGLTSDFGVAIHHARSFNLNFSAYTSTDTTETYSGGGVTQSRESQTHTAPPQTTTTTKDISGMTLTKQALYYKSGLNVSLADYGKYTDTAMTTALMNDYSANGMIDPVSGEYYEFKITGKGNASGYVYPIIWASSEEIWPDSYEGGTAAGTSISTTVSTKTAYYGTNAEEPTAIDFSSGAQFGVSLADATSYTLNTIEINVYRYTSGGGGDSSETTSTTSTTTTTQTTTTQGGGGAVTGNLIVNGDFSNGITGWTAAPSSIASVSDGKLNISGNYYKDITVNASFSSVIGNGKTYTLRFDLTTTSGVTVKVHNNYGDGSGSRQSYSTGGTYTFTTASTVSSDSSDSKAKFSIYVAGPKETDLSAVLDNFVLVEGNSIPDDDESSVTPTTYNVTVTNGTADKSTAAAGETVTITANDAATGYQFSNWTATGATLASTTNTVTTFTMPASDVSVTANYTKINYTVSVTLGTASKSTANYGDTVTLTANSPATGMEFDKWVVKTGSAAVSFANASSTSTTFSMPAGNVSVEATYKAKTYTVTVTKGTATPTSQMYNNTVTLVANTPDTGYQFSGWTSSDGITFANASSSTTTFTMPAKNVSVTANYTKINYTVSVTGGTASKSTANYGDTITLTPNTPSGYTFTGWTSSDVTITNNTFTMPAKNVSITAGFSEVINEPDPPQTPVLVSAVADGANVIVTWNAVTSADGYRVYRKTGSGAFATVKDITGGATVTYTDTDPGKGTYTYTVQAYVNGTSDKVWGDYDATGKTATVTFGAPTLTSAVASTSGITVTWQKVTGASGYRLYHKDDGNWVTVKTISDVNTVSYLAKGLVAGQTYTYTVQAYYDSTATGTTQWSGYDSTGVSAVAQFGSPESDAQANGMKITITWASVTGAEGYRIYRKTADSSWRTIATVAAPTTTYTDETPVANVYYTYTVQAYATESSKRVYSAYDVTGTTKRVTLGTPTLSEAEKTGEGVVVSWEATTGATGYRLYRWNGTAWKTVKTVIGINTTSYTDTSAAATAGTKYTVQAFRNANGVVVWSDHDDAGVVAE